MSTSDRFGNTRHYTETKGPNLGGDCYVEKFPDCHRTEHVRKDNTTVVNTHQNDEPTQSEIAQGNTRDVFEDNLRDVISDAQSASDSD